MDCDGEGPCHAKLHHAVPCHATPSCAVPCRAMLAKHWPSTGEEPKETTVPGSAGRCSPGLGGSISDVRVQSQEQEEGAEPAGRVFKPIGSRSSRQGRGKGAACLIIALIKQARSEQDPTLSTPHQGLCRSCQGQVPPHPSTVLLSPGKVTIPFCPYLCCAPKFAPKRLPHPHQTARVTSGVTLDVHPLGTRAFGGTVRHWLLAGCREGGVREGSQ